MTVPDDLHRQALLAYQQGRAVQALSLIDLAIAGGLVSAAIHCNRGVILAALGRHDLALPAYDQSLARDGQFTEAHHNRGNSLQALGRPDAATASLRRALCLGPGLAQAADSLGAALAASGALPAAVLWHRRALHLAPGSAGAHNNLAVALRHLDQLDLSLQHLRLALALRPSDADALSNLGGALKDLGQPAAALAPCRRALRLSPALALAHSNLGAALQRQDRLDQAGLAFRRALSLQPSYFEAWINAGGQLTALGRPAAAVRCFERGLTLAPDSAEARWNRGVARLTLGRLAEGWPDYEARWQLGRHPAQPPRRFATAPWTGEQGDGQPLLLWAEQGFGDQIQFVRYVEAVRGRGWRVLLDVPPPLQRLFHPLAELSADAAKLPQGGWAHCALPSLPGVFGSTLATLPATIPYLAAEPALAARWRQRLARHPGRRIGLAWRGNSAHSNDRNRSLDVALLASAFVDLDPCSFTLVSLQRDTTAIEQALVRRRAGWVDAGPELEDFADSAALMANLDLIISVDSAVCHLAGALGRPVWTLLPFAADWRWLQQRSDSPWYPGMRLLRQPAPGDWPAVLDALRLALGNWAAA